MGENTVELFYEEEKPAWRIRVPQPERFRGVEFDIRFRLFQLSGSVLIGCWLRLFDIPDQPYFVHRVLDLCDETVWEYMERLRDTGEVVLVFESTGSEGGFSEEISIGDAGAAELLDEASDLVGAARDGADGESTALEDFMEIFNASLRERKDVGQAWDAVVEKFPPQDVAGKKRRKWFGLF